MKLAWQTQKIVFMPAALTVQFVAKMDLGVGQWSVRHYSFTLKYLFHKDSKPLAIWILNFFICLPILIVSHIAVVLSKKQKKFLRQREKKLEYKKITQWPISWSIVEFYFPLKSKESSCWLGARWRWRWRGWWSWQRLPQSFTVFGYTYMPYTN